MIFCCGEALIDMLPRQTTEGETSFAPYTGGAIFNTAIALGRLETPVGYFGGLSTDLFGTMLADKLTEANVDISRANRSSRPTTLAFVTLTNGQAKYAFYDENTAGRMITEAELPGLSDDDTCLFFGCISLVSEPGADSLATLCTEHAGDRLVMIDVNVRESFITDEAAYRARLEAMLPRADIVKVSDEDMAWLDTTPDQLIANGTQLVLVTRGSDGVDVHLRDTHRKMPAMKVEVVDTVGAGDTFNGGLLAGLQEAGLLSRAAMRTASLDDLAPAVDLGVRAAAITVSRAGANPPWKHEL